MTLRRPPTIFAALALLSALAQLSAMATAYAAEPGGGSRPTSDCIVEYEGFALNYPPPPVTAHKEFRCFDGDPACDADGVENGECAFTVQMCFAGSDVPGCSAGTVSELRVANPSPSSPRHDPELAALKAAGEAVLPASNYTCSAPVTLTAPTGSKNGKKVRVRAASTTGVDTDKFRLTCIASGWPKYMHDLANTGTNPNETTLGTGNVANLQVLWDFKVNDKSGLSHYVSASPTVANDRVFIGSWNGIMYALRASDGHVVWKFDTDDPNPFGRGGLMGIQSSATVLADGRVYFGAADAYYYCVDDRGRLLWRTQIGNPDETNGGEGAHAWSSPAIHDGKVFVGRASHDDGPCIRGRIYALDQDTGAIVWQVNVVPERVCDNAPTTTCTTSAECGAGNCISNKVCTKQAAQFCNTNADCDTNISGNVCIEARGGAVWSSAAVDPARNEVYVSTGDCLQQGAIGDAESLMAFDLDTGARHWAVRANPIGETADFDFGSSPAVFTATDGVTTLNLVGAGNKNGAYYAVDQDTGLLAWSKQVVAGSALGGFLGSSAVADGQIFSGTFTGPPYIHALDAFDGTFGPLSFTSSNGRTFAATTYANGVVYVGSQKISFLGSGANRFRAFNGATGALLLDRLMPGGVASGATIVNGRVYVGYGVFLDAGDASVGGVQALGLP